VPHFDYDPFKHIAREDATSGSGGALTDVTPHEVRADGASATALPRRLTE